MPPGKICGSPNVSFCVPPYEAPKSRSFAMPRPRSVVEVIAPQLFATLESP